MSLYHYREVCACGVIIKQCQCFHRGNRRETRGVCFECRSKGQSAAVSFNYENTAHVEPHIAPPVADPIAHIRNHFRW